MGTGNRWLPYYRPKPSARARMFCFPYAGGGASVFNRWADAVPDSVDVCAVQLPGRENRLSEPAFDRMDRLAEAVAEGLTPHLDGPFLFFGHSMGARLGFELVRLLRGRGLGGPQCLIVSAGRAPHVPRDIPPIHNLPDAAFTDRLRRLHNVPEQVLQDAELRELFLPLLRADFAVVETYRYEDGDPLECPIAAFGGLGDETMPRPHVEAWKDVTRGRFTIEMMPGDHFFLNSNRDELLRRVSAVLEDVVSALP